MKFHDVVVHFSGFMIQNLLGCSRAILLFVGKIFIVVNPLVFQNEP